MVRRVLAGLVLAAALVGGPLTGPAVADWGNPALQGPLHPMTFPVIGPVSYTDTFGAPRIGHTHQGQDLMGAKMQPLVAAADGTISYITIPQASYGYMLSIRGDDEVRFAVRGLEDL